MPLFKGSVVRDPGKVAGLACGACSRVRALLSRTISSSAIQ